MTRVCILSAVNIRHMTMISLYTERLKRDNIEYDIIYMDKYGEKEEFSANKKFVFTNLINQKRNRVIKTLKYFKFRPYATAILEENQYDFIIVWNDIAIIMFGDYLSKKWPGRYCLNIRDIMVGKNLLVDNQYKRAIKNSAYTTISSDAFKKYLPDHDYVFVHSLNEKQMSKISPRKSFQSKNVPIRITFIGYIRYMAINKRLMDIFKNDSRFQLNFFGTRVEELEKYALDHNMKNVDFYGTFPVKDTYKFIEKTDLVNNLYGNETKNLRTALSNKLYQGIYNRTPILVYPKTYMAKIIKKYQIGYVVSQFDEDLPDQIFNWYHALSFQEFNKNCEKIMCEIEQNHDQFDKHFTKYFLS